MAYAEGKKRLLAPLEPNAFLRWTWEGLPPATRGPQPLTLEDLWWEIGGHVPEYTPDMLRQDYVRLAAHVRFNQRIGLDPWDGIGAWTGWKWSSQQLAKAGGSR